ncbi:MAG: transposase, partial [Spirochaetes bacterium]|nr:transposase [Spirochaetota bacterium]
MRQCRILQKGAKYHVSSKINRSENIFENDEIKKLFMDVVKRAKKKYKFIVHNFVIMNNHIHIYISRKKEVIYNKLKSIHKDNNTYSIATELRYILKVFLRGVEMYGINKFLLLLKSAEKKW